MSSHLAQLREAIELANDLTKAHILFVPVPVVSEEDHRDLKHLLATRLQQISKAE